MSIEDTVKDTKPRLLNVEDLSLLANMNRRFLTRYDVDIAGDYATAVKMYRQAFDEGRPYSHLLFDTRFPNGESGEGSTIALQNGPRLLKKFQGINPALDLSQVVACSGDLDGEDYWASQGFADVSYLPKPYSPSELRDAFEK